MLKISGFLLVEGIEKQIENICMLQRYLTDRFLGTTKEIKTVYLSMGTNIRKWLRWSLYAEP